MKQQANHIVFLYCNLTKSDIDEVFMKNFTHRIMISDGED